MSNRPQAVGEVQQVEIPEPRLGHAEGSQAPQVPPVQTYVVQSVVPEQPLPGRQRLHAGPPQSASVSVPSFCPFAQVAAAPHVPNPFPCCPAQTPLAQSGAALHPLPTRHTGHEPPQSTPVSSPSLTASVQVAARHTPLTQWLVTQSVALTQPFPFSHLAQAPSAPPQSTSLSSMLRTPSVHDAATQRPPVHSRSRQSLAPAHA